MTATRAGIPAMCRRMLPTRDSVLCRMIAHKAITHAESARDLMYRNTIPI